MAGINITIHKKPDETAILKVGNNEVLLYQSNVFDVSAEMPYPHYPITIWENNEYVFITEGYFFTG